MEDQRRTRRSRLVSAAQSVAAGFAMAFSCHTFRFPADVTLEHAHGLWLASAKESVSALSAHLNEKNFSSCQPFCVMCSACNKNVPTREACVHLTSAEHFQNLNIMLETRKSMMQGHRAQSWLSSDQNEPGPQCKWNFPTVNGGTLWVNYLTGQHGIVPAQDSGCTSSEIWLGDTGPDFDVLDGWDLPEPEWAGTIPAQQQEPQQDRLRHQRNETERRLASLKMAMDSIFNKDPEEDHHPEIRQLFKDSKGLLPHPSPQGNASWTQGRALCTSDRRTAEIEAFKDLIHDALRYYIHYHPGLRRWGEHPACYKHGSRRQWWARGPRNHWSREGPWGLHSKPHRVY